MMETTKDKPSVLLCWWYERNDLFLPFHKLSDSFNYILLFRKFSSEDQSQLPYPKVYWSEFRSAHDLLNKVKPDKVIFMGIDSNYSLALNIACKHKGIPTIFLEHGFRLPLSYYTQKEEENNLTQFRRNDKTKVYNKKKWHSLFFLLFSLRLKNLPDIIQIFKTILNLYRLPVAKALKNSPYSFRLPDVYIGFTSHNQTYLIERDRIDERRIRCIGNPFWDHYFQDNGRASPTGKPFYILIDTPIWKGKELGFNVGAKERDFFYKKLASYCLSKGAMLYIKLHPVMFENADLPQYDNVNYLKDVDVAPYFRYAKGCFGIFSLMVLPAIYFSPTLLFRYESSPVQTQLEELGVVNTADLLTFSQEDIVFPNYPIEEKTWQSFIERYFYYTDGKSQERLKKVIEEV